MSPSLTPGEAERVMSVLLGEIQSAYEYSTITDVAVRAELLWQCDACYRVNYPTGERCANCQFVRPGAGS